MGIAIPMIRRLERKIDAMDDYTIYGCAWGKGESPVLTRTDAAVGMVANVGVDGR